MNKLLKQIEINPDKVREIDDSQLSKILTRAKELYYNSDPIISDETFDYLEKKLNQRDPDNPYFKKIGAPVRKDVIKVRLPSHMGSLDKIKPGTKELERWFSKYKGPFFVSEKLDGISGLITHKYIYTRGDGTHGQDISYLRPYLNIPKMSKEFCVRGEFVVTNSIYIKKYSKDYPLPRTLVNSIINSKTPDVNIIKDIEFLAYEIVKNNGDAWSNQFDEMKKLGFKTSRGEKIDYLDSDILTKLYFDWSGESNYDIDGLVVSQDEKYFRNIDGNPKYSVAFKVNSDGLKTKVISVSWNASKFGVLFPTVMIEPINFEGVIVKKASGKNAKFILKNGIGKGSEIKVIYSGGVIPEISKILKKKEPDFPKELDYHWNETEVNIILNNPLQSKEVKIHRLLHMFETLEIKGVNIGIVTKFYENGFDTVSKIYSMTRKDFMKIPGFKDKTTEKIYNYIHEVLDLPIPLEKIMTMSLVFGNGFAEKRFKLIIEEIPDIMETYESLTVDRIRDIKGFSQKTATVFIQGLPKFTKFLQKASFIKIKENKLNHTGNNKMFKGKNFVFSGFRDQEIKNTIENSGGKVTDTVTGKTNILIIKELTNPPSSKIKKAESLGIDIITKEDFLKKFHL